MQKREIITTWFKYKSLKKIDYVWAYFFGFLTIVSLISVLFIGIDLKDLWGPLLLSIIPIRVILLHNKFQSMLSENEFDLWLDKDIQAVIKNRPYSKLGISKEDLVAESLLVVGPVYWELSGFDKNDILMKRGKDGFNRYTTWTIQLFVFTENYLCSYKCHYNWIKNTYINESTNEFFYKDVVSVKTDTISSAYTLMNGERLVHSEAFQLKLAGDEITVITNDVNLNTSSVMVSKAEKAVQSIRAMLRDKKK
jgi:hypothetical protein